MLTVGNADDYEHACGRLNDLLDEIGEDETHPLYELLNALGALVHAYEETHQPMPPCRGQWKTQPACRLRLCLESRQQNHLQMGHPQSELV